MMVFGQASQRAPWPEGAGTDERPGRLFGLRSTSAGDDARRQLSNPQDQRERTGLAVGIEAPHSGSYEVTTFALAPPEGRVVLQLDQDYPKFGNQIPISPSYLYRLLSITSGFASWART
jgi:hypothetical protein